MPTCLVTGGSGFLGRHLLERLLLESSPGLEALVLGRRLPLGWPIERFLECDFENRERFARTVVEIAPSTVFHLAGRTPPAVADDYYRQNLLATIRLLDALHASGRPCRAVLVGSAAELGPVPVEDLPVGEDYPCHPAEPYGLSKWLSTAAGLAARPPLEVIVARVFNPIGPGMPSSQALGRFADALANGSGPLRLRVGDLGIRRDFVDARDVARALVALALNGTPGRVYHVGTGRSQRVGEGLDRLIALSGREATIESDTEMPRSPGPPDSRADIRRITAETGWSPEIPWEQSLLDLWVAALARARAGLTDPPPSV
jgi:GDP-4-dehydro-6-deoxy-D-mannose reductase